MEIERIERHGADLFVFLGVACVQLGRSGNFFRSAFLLFFCLFFFGRQVAGREGGGGGGHGAGVATLDVAPRRPATATSCPPTRSVNSRRRRRRRRRQMGPILRAA